MLDNIPVAMRNFEQWICYRTEVKPNGKTTKIPHCPQTGRLASHSSPVGWTTFQHARRTFEMTNFYDGIGFVFTKEDPFFVIDMDLTDGSGEPFDPDVFKTQQEIAASFKTYKEVSPGGGLHIIGKGSIPSGRKLSSMGLEIYSSLRFMTMTGNVFDGCTEIKQQQSLASQLWDYIGAQQTNNTVVYDGSAPADKDDLTIFNIAAKAANGDKFVNLWNGQWQHYYTSQSEADFALCNIIAYYTPSKDQLRNMFYTSALGKRDKAKRPAYVEPMFSKAFDQKFEAVNMDALFNELQEFRSSLNGHVVVNPEIKLTEEPVYVEPEKPNYTANEASTGWDNSTLPRPPGLLGLIADYTLRSSPHPVPEIAVGTAIALMAGVAGKAYNVMGAGLNHYLLMLAETGIGKNAIQNTIDKLIGKFEMIYPMVGDFVGPRDFSSGQAASRFLADHPTKCCISVVGEFGSMLKRLSDDSFNPNVSLKNMLLDLFTKSGANQKLRGSAYSDVTKNIGDVSAPALSLIGDSQPSIFYDGLSEPMVKSGVIPRFLILQYAGKQCYENFEANTAEVDSELMNGLGILFSNALTRMNQGQVQQISFDSEADKARKAYSRYCTDKRNSNEGSVVGDLWVRAKMKVNKLAALAAVGLNPAQPVITTACLEWAQAIIESDILNLQEQFKNGVIGGDSDELKQIAAIKKVITKFLISDHYDLLKDRAVTVTLEMYNHGVIPHNFISRNSRGLTVFKKALIGSGNAIKRALQTLIDDGDIAKLTKHEALMKFSFNGDCYVIQNKDILEKARAARFAV